MCQKLIRHKSCIRKTNLIIANHSFDHFYSLIMDLPFVLRPPTLVLSLMACQTKLQTLLGIHAYVKSMQV